MLRSRDELWPDIFLCRLLRKPRGTGATMAKAMNEKSFVEKREPEWRRLDELVNKATFRTGALSPAEFREFLACYRRASRDLAVARTQSDNAGLIDFLNDLVGRSYGTLYRAPVNSLGRSILTAIETIAQTFRRRILFVAASATIFIASILFGFIALSSLPQTREFFVPDAAKESFESWKKGEFEERDGSAGALMTGFYAMNNPKAAVVTGSLGAGTFGLASIFLIYNNGVMLGALAHETNSVGHLDFLLSSISPHGVPELSGLVVSGAAGLLLGWSLLFPGRQSRASSIRSVGKDAIVLLGASVLLMFIAAPIEGFFSFDPRAPGALKVTVALIEVIAWGAFWTFVGRERDSLKPTTRVHAATVAEA
ncbi:stage II sporulation protein M [bacterium]|nr:MAG: stage II sporulation protein M [bacterium]